MTIDGRQVDFVEGATIVEAARSVGIEIPTLCASEGYKPCVTCMVCVVRIEGMGRLVPACATPARRGITVHTNTPEVIEARRTNIELLLSEHAGDCEGPCRVACAASLRIPQMLRAMAADDMAVAKKIAVEDLILPGTLGQICPAPCKKVCRRGKIDHGLDIPQLHGQFSSGGNSEGAEVAFEFISKSAAIVGSGPAGLAAAKTLLDAGVVCTLIERKSEIGGGMLEAVATRDAAARAMLDSEVQGLVSRQGISLRHGVEIILAEQVNELLAACDIVIWACGAAPSPLTDERLFAATTGKGSKLAVKAISEGKRAARRVLAFWGVAIDIPPENLFNARLGKLDEQELELLRRAEGADDSCREHKMHYPSSDTAKLVAPSARAAAPIQRHSEAGHSICPAQQCLHCDCRGAETCKLRKLATQFAAKSAPQIVPQRNAIEQDSSHPDGLIYESGKCIRCGLCVALAEQRGEQLTMSHRGFATKVVPALATCLAEVLGANVEQYAALCPTGAMEMKKVTVQNPFTAI